MTQGDKKQTVNCVLQGKQLGVEGRSERAGWELKAVMILRTDLGGYKKTNKKPLIQYLYSMDSEAKTSTRKLRLASTPGFSCVSYILGSQCYNCQIISQYTRSNVNLNYIPADNRLAVLS